MKACGIFNSDLFIHTVWKKLSDQAGERNKNLTNKVLAKSFLKTLSFIVSYFIIFVIILTIASCFIDMQFTYHSVHPFKGTT